jgi:signal transduction histidine kinase
MELLDGRPLSRLIKSGPARFERALPLISVLVDAVAAVHGAGLAHGDIKPDNILVGSVAEGRVWLVDFGAVGSQTGTLRYASLERLKGEKATPAADIYALGLVIWEVLHGVLLWEEEGTATMLLRRNLEPPASQSAPSWFGSLLHRMLSPDPNSRCSAQEVVDALDAQGINLPISAVHMLQRRFSSIHLPLPAVQQRLEAWLPGGGVLGIYGKRGLGKSHYLRQAQIEIQARGGVLVRLKSCTRHWEGAELLLQSPALPGAVAPLPLLEGSWDRAEAVAALVEERLSDRLVVIVDNADELDEGTSQTLEALARRGRVDLLVAAKQLPGWVQQSIELPSWDKSLQDTWLSELLGDQSAAQTIQNQLGGSNTTPASLQQRVVAAAASGALLHRAGRWQVDGARLLEMLEKGAFEEREHILGSEARATGVLVALAGRPIKLELIQSIIGNSLPKIRDALNELWEAGLVQEESDGYSCTSRIARQQLAPLPGEGVKAAQALLLVEQKQAQPSPVRLGWLLVAAGDTAGIQKQGEQLILRCCRIDSAEACRLAAAMAGMVQQPELVAAYIRALLAAGRVGEAVGLGMGWLEDHPAGHHSVYLALLRAMNEQNVPLSEVESILVRLKNLEGKKRTIESLSCEIWSLFQARRLSEVVALARFLPKQPPFESSALDGWLRVQVCVAQSLQEQGHAQEAIARLEQIPLKIGEGTPAGALLLSARGRMYWINGRFREAGNLLEQAAKAGSGLAAAGRARAMNNAGIASYQAGDRTKALERWEAALLLFEALKIEVEQIRVCNNLCCAYREAGRWERARQAGDWAYKEAGRLKQVELEAMAAGNLGDLSLAQAELEGAERWYSKARGVAEANRLEGELVELARRNAELLAVKRSPELQEAASAALALARKHSVAVEEARSLALLALAQARTGAMEEEAALREKIAFLKEQGLSNELAEVRLLLAEALLELGRAQEARSEADRVSVYAAEIGHIPLRSKTNAMFRRIRASQSTQSDDGKLQQLLQLVVLVSRERNLDRLLATIAQAALDLLASERAFVLTLEQNELKVAASASKSSEPGVPSLSIVRRAVDQRSEVIAGDLLERADLRAAQSVQLMKLGCVMCVPLIEGDQVLGAIYVDSHLATEQELSDAAKFMRALAAHAAIALANARHMAELAARAQWAAEVAHDLKNPAGGVVTIARALLPKAAGAERQGFEDIIQLGSRAIQLAEGLVRRIERQTVEVDFSRLVLEHGNLKARTLKGEGLYLVVQVEPDLKIQGNPGELVRVLSNLLGNAAKYSPPQGSIFLNLSAESDRILLQISDQGSGIPEASLHRIFERGTQGVDARPGHGLGLAIVQNIVDAHHGTVRAFNREEGGACFLVSLPRVG